MGYPPKFAVGMNVKNITSNKIGTINAVIEGKRGYSYRVTIDGQIRTTLEDFLELVEDTEQNIITNYSEGKIGNFSDYRLFQTWYRLSIPLENNIYSYLGSKTLFNPHQFKPLIKFLSHNSDERLFIADEVGVGKTIESGIILKELLARERLDSNTPILIICPNSLTIKWAKEMQERFLLDFEILDGEKLRYILNITRQDNIFPKKYLRSIVGLQLFRRVENIDLLEQIESHRDLPLFGMVIIDEAHHLRNADTDSNRLGNTLSRMTDMMLLLSATPLNLHSDDLFNQMQILNPIQFPDQSAFETIYNPLVVINKVRAILHDSSADGRGKIITLLKTLESDQFGQHLLTHPDIINFLKRLNHDTPLSTEELVKYEHLLVSLNPLFFSFTRTRKREAFEHQVRREVIDVPIVLTTEELALQEEILNAMATYHMKEADDPFILGFVLNIYRRMISSCLPAALEYVKWALDNEKMVLIPELQMFEEIEDDTEFQYQPLNKNKIQVFQNLLEKSDHIITIDSKYSQFKALLEKILSNEEFKQIIVFSFFVRTLKHLEKRLKEDGYLVEIIHGDIPLVSTGKNKGRHEIIDSFKKGQFNILLSSEVGGEGLDFQFCKVIINYDLPYNPMRVEQRIGRIDRFGQQSEKIFIANLFIRNTVDEEIYERLYRRIHLIEDGIGALEPVLGKHIADLQTAIISGNLTEKEKEELNKRLEIAVEKIKIETENIESLKYSLVCDDYLAKPENSIFSCDFIKAEDAIAITEHYLNSKKGCSFKQINDYCCEILLSNEVIANLELYLRRPNNEYAFRELSPLIETTKPLKIIFDGKQADTHPNTIFLNPAGPWSRFLAKEIGSSKILFNNFAYAVKFDDLPLPPDQYVVFLFEVALEGLKTEIQLIGIPVSIKRKSVIDYDIEKMPRLLSNIAHSTPRIVDEINIELYEELFEIAREEVELISNEKRIRLASEVTFKLDGLIASLQQSSEKKIEKLQTTLSNHIHNRIQDGQKPDESFIRLTEGKINREKTQLTQRITDLNKRRDSSLTYSLEALIHLNVETSEEML